MQLESHRLGRFDHGIAIRETIHLALGVAGLLDRLDGAKRGLPDLIAQRVELNPYLPAELVVLLKSKEAPGGAGEKSGGGGGAQEGASSHERIGA